MMTFLQRRPVLATLLTGVGLAMLFAGLFALLASPATLERYAGYSNGYLWLMAAVILVGSLAVTVVVASVIELARAGRGARNGDDETAVDDAGPDEPPAVR